jgi:hypothetical protein
MPHRPVAAAFVLAVGAALGTAPGSPSTNATAWRPLVKVPGIVDVVGPRADGRLVLATRSGLFLLRAGRAPQPFARGSSGYGGAAGEPYLALAPARRLPGASCAFHRDDVFALDPGSRPGVVRITARGQAKRFMDFPAGAFPAGIAFDNVGTFGFRLLMTVRSAGKTVLYAADCRGRARLVTSQGPPVEGGIAVAPKSFGRFAGDLVAADEVSGNVLAFDSHGEVRLVVSSGLPAGGDIGVEALGFVRAPVGGRSSAYLADLGSPGSPTPGTDSLLVRRGASLRAARLRVGDLVTATEASARTLVIRCARRCTLRRIGIGPSAAHAEGHITVVSGR